MMDMGLDRFFMEGLWQEGCYSFPSAWNCVIHLWKAMGKCTAGGDSMIKHLKNILTSAVGIWKRSRQRTLTIQF